MADDQEFDDDDIELPDLGEVLDGLCEGSGVEGIFVAEVVGERSLETGRS